MGNGKFELIPLPQAVQLAPVTDIVTADYDGDNDEDIFIVGNDFSAEVFNGRLDALNGMVLRNDGKPSRFYQWKKLVCTFLETENHWLN